MATAKALGKRHKWAGTGTPIAFGSISGESTPVSLGIHISDSEVFAITGLFEECLHLRVEIAKLKAENEGLKAKVVAMQAANSAKKVLEIREIPREQAKEEIRAFFKAHHGEAIYPSDIMETLSLDYNLVYEICEELEKEGAVKGL